MGALTSAVIAIVALALGWITIEIACKPCLERGREAIDRSLDPNYDPDDEEANYSIRAPLSQNIQPRLDVPDPSAPAPAPAPAAASSVSKIV